MNQTDKIQLFTHDISREFAELALDAKTIGWDIETSGLDWRVERIATSQIALPNGSVALVRINNSAPHNLVDLLSNPHVRKVFHHAMFDLRFMCNRWKVYPANIACTRIAAKLLDPTNKFSHSLQSVLSQYLNIEISKEERLSNWFSEELTDEQINYAVNDVLFLVPLISKLEEELRNHGFSEIAHSCFAYIPARVQMDLLGFGNIFDYS